MSLQGRVSHAAADCVELAVLKLPSSEADAEGMQWSGHLFIRQGVLWSLLRLQWQ